ncbi:MAG: PilZ domain-containing protein [Nannocystaceae bacterium]|nr:PilZ domain-containing protein [Nannocystaceae bacterium]
MAPTRNSKGQLEDYGQREVELPSESETPAGWVRSDDVQAGYAPSADVVFDNSGRPSGVTLQPLRGNAAVTTILRFFNLSALERKGRLGPEKEVEHRHLQVQLQDGATHRGLRDWMRLPVSVEVLVGPRRSPGLMKDLGAGGLRLEDVEGRFMVGTRIDVMMPLALGQRHGTIVFTNRVAWANAMRKTLGLEFTAAPSWHER